MIQNESVTIGENSSQYPPLVLFGLGSDLVMIRSQDMWRLIWLLLLVSAMCTQVCTPNTLTWQCGTGIPRTRPPYFSRMVACCRFALHVITIIYWMSSMLGTRNTYFSVTFKGKPRHLYAFVINCLYHTSIVSRPLGQKGLKGQCYHPSTLQSHRQCPQRTQGSLTVPSFLCAAVT